MVGLDLMRIHSTASALPGPTGMKAIMNNSVESSYTVPRLVLSLVTTAAMILLFPVTASAQYGSSGGFGWDTGPSADMALSCADCVDSAGGQVYRPMLGVDGTTCQRIDGEPRWENAHMIPWEAFAYGEFMGPTRTPHLPQYRVYINDQIEFVYQLTREQQMKPYRLQVGDEIEVSSAADEELNQVAVRVQPDGSISLRLIGRVMAARKTIEELQSELNQRYRKFFATNPAIVVRGTITDIRVQDLIDAVDARFGSGGQARQTTVSPDGTVQLPMIGSVPAIGLTLDELKREVNARYRERIQGFEVTPILVQRAPRFIYVLGEVAQPGRFELTGPTSAIQSIALAGGWNPGGNLRQIIVFRRDHNWQLMAIRLDLNGALQGRRPFPSDEIWLRDSDIVIVPKQPIQRLADAVDLYFTRTLYAAFPTQFAIDGLSNIGFNAN